jgi:hypothetical protein
MATNLRFAAMARTGVAGHAAVLDHRGQGVRPRNVMTWVVTPFDDRLTTRQEVDTMVLPD